MRNGIEQIQTQKLSPRMEQSVRILQMNEAELNEYLSAVMVENPMLELDAAPEPQAQYAGWGRSRSMRHTGAAHMIDDLLCDGEGQSLEEHLLTQIHCQYSGDIAKAMAKLVGCVDGNGYLTVSRQELVKALGCGEEAAGHALCEFKKLDPPGVGSVDLCECLSAQLDADDALALRIVKSCLGMLASADMRAISKALGCSELDAAAAAQRIRALNPRPGLAYQKNEAIDYAIPDVIIMREGNSFVPVMRDDQAAALQPSGYYMELLENTDDEEVERYLREKLEQLEWIRKCIEGRSKTLLALCRLIIEKQSRFFTVGPNFLDALSMKEASGLLGVHESTVSRAASSKYLQCAYGVFSLKHFFVRGVSTPGKASSVTDVKRKLELMIVSETRGKPFSDRQLAEMLSDQGIKISRRTVAKYRDELGLRDSFGRCAKRGRV